MTEPEREVTFEAWLSQYKALLFKVVRSYAFTAMDREDLFQEIAIQVWRSIPAFRSESSVATWLYRISLNTAIKWKRKEQRRDGGEEAVDDVQHILSEKETEIDEKLEWLYTEVSRLNEIDRSITLLLLDGFSYGEMSDILGITESNVGVKINRIKKHLIAKSKNTAHHGI